LKRGKENKNPARGPGQPRIDAEGVLERRSVGLPAAWWREIDRLTKSRNIKAAGLVRTAVGVYLKKIRRAETSITRRKNSVKA
jgi:hypothetical protein